MKSMGMNTLLKLEELAQFGLGILLFTQFSYPWWLFPVLLLLPDIGMLGYVVNSKAGAVTYNLFHQRCSHLARHHWNVIFTEFEYDYWRDSVFPFCHGQTV